MDPSSIFLMWAFLLVGLAFVLYVILADRTRFLARYDLEQWSESYYLRSLPNFLQALDDSYFPTAWPVKCNALSAAFFRFRARALLLRKPAELRRAFLHQHTVLFALRENLRPYLEDFILSQQQRIVGTRVADMEDTLDRDRLLAFLEAARQYREDFYAGLTGYDRQILLTMIERHFIPTLRTAEAIFQEHGFTLLPEFTQLRRWQEMSGTELVSELPALPPTRRAKSSPPIQVGPDRGHGL